MQNAALSTEKLRHRAVLQFVHHTAPALRADSAVLGTDVLEHLCSMIAQACFQHRNGQVKVARQDNNEKTLSQQRL